MQQKNQKTGENKNCIRTQNCLIKMWVKPPHFRHFTSFVPLQGLLKLFHVLNIAQRMQQ